MIYKKIEEIFLNTIDKIIILILITKVYQFGRTNKFHRRKQGAPIFDFDPFKAKLI